MASRWARFARGWLTAVLAVLVAALSHVAGGGDAPGLISIAIALAFSGIVCVALAGKTLSLARLTLSVGFSQVAFHMLFGLGGHSSSALSVAGAPHHGSVSIIVDTATSSAMTHGTMHGGPWMLAGHVGAAILTIIALRRGETTFWTLLEYARWRMRAVLVARFVLIPLRRRIGGANVALARACIPPDLGVLLSTMPHRGPPRAVAFH